MSRAPMTHSHRSSLRSCRVHRQSIRPILMSMAFAATLGTDLFRAQDPQAAIDEYVSAYHQLGDFSGCVMVARRDTPLFERCYGQADYELAVANTPATKFRIGSISKQFTAAAILVLEARGLIDVADPIGKHLPDYPNGDRITIHHLLTHSSGIPNIFAVPGYESVKRSPVTPEELVALFETACWTSSPASGSATATPATSCSLT